jgi:hypothetical protein
MFSCKRQGQNPCLLCFYPARKAGRTDAASSVRTEGVLPNAQVVLKVPELSHFLLNFFFFNFVDSSGAICYLGVSSQSILRLVHFIISSKKE